MPVGSLDVEPGIHVLSTEAGVPIEVELHLAALCESELQALLHALLAVIRNRNGLTVVYEDKREDPRLAEPEDLDPWAFRAGGAA